MKSVIYPIYLILVAINFTLCWPLHAEQPNVVFLLVDDLGYMDIGANNPETFYETPNIDHLAASGMRFTNGYAANPVCSPTRYSILTGKYPSRVDATNFFAGKRSGRFNPAPLNDRMPLEEITLAEAFKSADYATFFAGKWHLGPTEQFWPKQQGFDVNKGGIGLVAHGVETITSRLTKTLGCLTVPRVNIFRNGSRKKRWHLSSNTAKNRSLLTFRFIQYIHP